MEEIGRHFGIADRATLCRANDLAFMITRTCGRLPQNEESARQVIALELACQENGLLNGFDHHLAAKITNRPLPMYMKLCDRIVNALLSSETSSELKFITIDGIAAHFNCTHLVPAIHACIAKLPSSSLPWRCLVGASLIVISAHKKCQLVPMRVAEYIHVAWKDVQNCVKQIKALISNEELESICALATAKSVTEETDKAIDTVVRRLKQRSVPYLFSDEPKFGRYAHIGINRVSLVP